MFRDAPLNEKELICRMTEGDEKAFSLLYNHYCAGVHAFALQWVHSAVIAEDITQDIFLKIWESRERMPEIRSFKNYLFIVTRNHVLNTLKKASSSKAVFSEIFHHYRQAQNITEESLQSKEYLHFIRSRLEALPSRSREVFQLCRENTRSYEEVARELGISRNAVKNRMVYTMKILKDAAEKEMGLTLSVIIYILFFSWK
ncbi:MAG: RNA polymerase sigma-70 factor [Chitinophagaceae bacterium]|nr:RNA polymerase sigma-70 factor [Chitinophagaceae bacterium]